MAKRRANGEGSIYKRKDGLWAAQYTDNAGKTRYLYGKTQQIVKDKLKKAINQSDAGLIMDKDKITFADWMKEWLEVYIRPTVRPKTYSLYHGNIYNHIIPAFPKVLLKDVRADMLQKFFNDKAVGGRIDGKPGGLSLSVLKDIKKVIVAAMKQAVDNRIIAYSDASKVRLPQQPYTEKEILSKDEQRRLEDVISTDSNPLSFAIMLNLYTGLRIGELLGLTLDDIDIQKKELYVRRSRTRYAIPEEHRTVMHLAEPKTPKARRTIPLPDFMVELLEQYIKDRNETVAAVAGLWRGKTPEEAKLWKDEGYLFLTVYGTGPDPAAIRRIFTRLLRDAEVRRINFHALRHTFATRCIEAGFDVRTLADILGHMDAKITLNTYAHALEEQKRDNMNKLVDVFTREDENEDTPEIESEETNPEN